MSYALFTSESVSSGHPDKVADQIADAILDAHLKKDPNCRVACEVLLSIGMIFITGEITSQAIVDYSQIARKTIEQIGYIHSSLGLDFHSCAVLSALNKQSPDISQGVSGEGLYKGQGAGDQGMAFGYACDETASFMPLPITLANQLIFELNRLRISKTLPYLCPDAKTQVTIAYDKMQQPVRVHSVVISTQHLEDIDQATIKKDMIAMAKKVIPESLLDSQTHYFINPTGRFVQGGPASDCGLTGRKIMVDTYGSMGRHGGGSFSGKDPTKVDRSGAYAARYVAKNIVAAKLAKRCEVQIAYAIGVPYPIAISIEAFGTQTVELDRIVEAIPKVFDLTPAGIIQMLDLKRAIYQKTAWGGHFGRDEPEFTWERTDRVEQLQKAVRI